jgi:hypothetical protein
MTRSGTPTAFQSAVLGGLRTRGVEDVEARTLEAWIACGGIGPPPRPRLRGYQPGYVPEAAYLDRVVAFRELVRTQGLPLDLATLVLASRGEFVEPRRLRSAFLRFAMYAEAYGVRRGQRLRRGPSAWRMLERDLVASGHEEDAEELATARSRRLTPDAFLDRWRSQVGRQARTLVESCSAAELAAALRAGRARALSAEELAKRQARGLVDGAEYVAPLHALDLLAESAAPT